MPRRDLERIRPKRLFRHREAALAAVAIQCGISDLSLDCFASLAMPPFSNQRALSLEDVLNHDLGLNPLVFHLGDVEP